MKSACYTVLMPLFDYLCLTCDAPSTQLVKNADATVACPACGSLNMARQPAPFVARSAGSTTTPKPERAPTPAERAFKRHVCTSGCQHAKADALVKKHLG